MARVTIVEGVQHRAEAQRGAAQFNRLIGVVGHLGEFVGGPARRAAPFVDDRPVVAAGISEVAPFAGQIHLNHGGPGGVMARCFPQDTVGPVGRRQP